MSAFTREQLLELASAYALGSLSSEEAAAVEAAVPGDAQLAAEIVAFRETMAIMLRAEAPIAARPGVREEWLRRVRENRTGAERPASVRPIDARRAPSRGTWIMSTALAAALVGAMVLGVELRTVQHQLADATAAEEKRERQLNTVLEAQGGLMVALLKGADANGPGVQFFWNVRQQRAMVHAFHLPPAPQGRSYQLWVLRGSTAISARVFNSDADGHALVEKILLPDSPAGITKVAITIEPEGGSPQPTSAPIMVGDLLKGAQ